MNVVPVSTLDLFSRPAAQTSIEHTSIKDHYPISSTIESGPLEFLVQSSGDEYIDLASSYLQITAEIKQKAFPATVAEDYALPVNNWGQSIFQQVDVSLNGKLVSNSTNTYPYRAYIETLLSFGKATKKTFLTNVLWYKDTAGSMDDIDVESDNPNKGAQQRKKLVGVNKKVDMIAYIHDDLFRQNRLLPPGMTVKIRFIRSSDSFNIMATKQSYTTIISKAILYVKKVKVSPNVVLAHANTLKNHNMQIPICRAECKVFSITKGTLSAYRENLISGQLPKRIVVGCVRNDSYNGSYSLNPFNFEHFNLKHLAVHVDGSPDVVPALNPDFANKLYIRSFHSLFGGVGKINTDEDFDVSRTDYDRGYTLYAFDLRNDDDPDTFDAGKSGSLRLDLEFGVALPRTINVVVYCEFENVIEINAARQVILDYSN